MELLTRLFITHGAVQAALVLAITIAFGILIGRIRVFGISFGIGGILFSGIILGHFGLSLDPKVLTFTREFGLILFVYAIGMAVGPTFIESLRDQGIKLNIMAVYIILCGALLAVACFYAFGLTLPQMAGLFCGGVTNTPALGSANEAWSLVAGSQDAVAEGLKVMGQAYAIAYPFGIFGIILTMILLKHIFRIDVEAEMASLQLAHPAHHENYDLSATSELCVSREEAAGKKLSALGQTVTDIVCLKRNNEEFPCTGEWRLRLGDKLILPRGPLADQWRKIVGDNPGHLAHPNMLSIFVGIFLGVFIGSIPVAVPGLPTGLRLGVAGGTLVLAIILSRVHRYAGLTWYLSAGANNLMREIGILLFMACVGLYAGGGFVETVVHGPGLRWMGIGAIITFVPLFTAAIFSRAVLKISFPTLCGMLAGSMTDPPALAFAMNFGGEPAAMGYATVYPLTMIMRILMGQLLVLLLIAYI